ncbi:nucleoporin SEH1 [Ditylenchus destructor]|nr:nucleoporin SEH1 [Ditylenchus destructor]
MLSFDIQHFPTCEHQDTIHHVEFDFYGKRVATVSSDKVVCIWDKTPTGWVKTAWWKKHGGAVWKARFAHPEYGQILATSSFDNTIQIFDKDATDSTEQISHTGVHIGRTDSSNGWSRRRVLTESTSNITDIQFAPHYLGLRLAACTAAGKIMIWEADDIMALENWNITFNFEASNYRLSSLTWSTNRYHPPLITASSDDADASSTEKLVMVKFNTNMTSYKPLKDKMDFNDQVTYVSFGPSAGLTYHKLGIAAGNSIYIYHLQVQGEDDSNGPRNQASTDQEFSIKPYVKLENGNSQVVRISWNILGDVISAVYADGYVRLWKYTFSNKWALVSVVNPEEAEKVNKDDVYY